MDKFIILGDSILNIGANIMQPYYDSADLMIAIGNNNVACSSTTQASQLNVRTHTTSGAGDLAYTLFYFPVEGFFEGNKAAYVKN